MSYTSLSLTNLASGETGFIVFDADSGFKVVQEITLNSNSYFKDITTGTSSNITTLTSLVAVNGSLAKDLSVTGNFSTLEDKVGSSILIGDTWTKITGYISDSAIKIGNTVGTRALTSGFTVANPGVITTVIPHGFSVDDPVAFQAIGDLPTGISENTRYYVGTVPSSTELTLSTSTSNGNPVEITAVASTVQHILLPIFELKIPAYLPNTISDSIVGKVTNNAGTYELEPYYTVAHSNDTPLVLVDSLPASGNYVGEAVLLTTTNTIYTWTGSAWDESAGLSVTTVNAYQRSATLPATPTGGSFNFSTNTLTPPSGWSASVPSGSDPIYVVSSGASVTGTSGTDTSLTWTTPVILAQDGADGAPGSPGDDGDPGLRTIQGYLYYEKTTAGAPSAPTGNTYTFSTGVVTGTGINDAGTTNVWKNSPNTQDPSSTNTHYTIRYYGTEAAASSSTIAVSYSSVVQFTDFSGVVTFSAGTFSQDGTDITTIDGGNIATDTIAANRLTLGNTTGTDRMKLYDDGIDIYSGGNLRVRIGNLSPTGRS